MAIGALEAATGGSAVMSGSANVLDFAFGVLPTPGEPPFFRHPARFSERSHGMFGIPLFRLDALNLQQKADIFFGVLELALQSFLIKPTLADQASDPSGDQRSSKPDPGCQDFRLHQTSKQSAKAFTGAFSPQAA
ncbi:hypothetical protein [Halochromatium roseum]|uniref:hypothetical protein n=1 Tax=Halochromatium roseum TaxID=391920 RepID=UPI001911F336|nr:hypothetical protein [Halochromatium roseum]